jgi:hypothetical protein
MNSHPVYQIGTYMTFTSSVKALRVLAAGTVLLGCTSTAPVPTTESAPDERSLAPADLGANYAALRASGETIFQLDPGKSEVRIHAFRGGRAAKLGHNHVLSAPRFAGYFHLPRDGTGRSGFDLEFRLDQLALDDPAQRSRLGTAFASELAAAELASARAHMLGADNFQADRFPFVRVHSLQIVGESPKFAAQVSIELHGRTRQMWVPLDVEGLPELLSVQGAFVLRQSDFDVRPYSVLGGLLAVEDAVVIEFRLLGAPRTQDPASGIPTSSAAPGSPRSRP